MAVSGLKAMTEDLMRGSIDMHMHAGPDSIRDRSVHALEAGLQAQAAGMRAIVLKSHEYPTAPMAFVVNQAAKEIRVFGTICMNYQVGGLNVHAVETHAKLGAKVVWMPTLSAKEDWKKRKLPGEGISLLDAKDKLVPGVREIMEVVKKYNIILATGHIAPVKEAMVLVEEARKMGLPKVVVTHPLELRAGSNPSIEEQKVMVGNGAIIEHCYVPCMPEACSLDPRRVVEQVKAVGVKNCFLSTDFGQAENAVPVEGMRSMIATYLKLGFTKEEMEILVKKNPARLLDLE